MGGRHVLLHLALRFDQRRGERRRIDWHLQFRPQIENRADVILVAVGEHDALEVLPLGLEKADVGHDQVDAGNFRVGEGHAHVDAEPFAPAAGAEPIEREVHADLADAAERHEQKLVVAWRHGQPALAIGNTSPAEIASRAPSALRNNSAPSSSIASKVPASVRSGSRTSIALPMPVARRSQAARMAAKPSPRFHWRERSPHRSASRASKTAGESSKPAAAKSLAGYGVSAG